MAAHNALTTSPTSAGVRRHGQTGLIVGAIAGLVAGVVVTNGMCSDEAGAGSCDRLLPLGVFAVGGALIGGALGLLLGSKT